MSDSFSTLKNFFETRSLCARALAHLKTGTEVGIIVGGQDVGALFFNSKTGLVNLDRRDAKKPDVIFEISADAVGRVTATSGDDIAGFGIAVLKEILNQHVHIRVVGSVFNIMTRGYIGVIGEGGTEFMKFLGQHGFSSLSKLPGLIKSMKKN